MGRNAVGPIIPHEVGTPLLDPHPARAVARTFPTEPNARISDRQIGALADSIIRYARWKRNLAEAREKRKLARHEKREAAA